MTVAYSEELRPLILQFGTSRFLQAHVDYFVSQSLANGDSATPVLVVQTSNSSAGKKRVAAMNQMESYPVHIQGLQAGKVVDRVEQVSSITGALEAEQDWLTIIDVFCQQVTHVISNTADDGYRLHDEDNELTGFSLIGSTPPKSYPAKLLVLLKARYNHNKEGLTIMPCELVADNGLVLKKLILSLAQRWGLSNAFITWLENHCIWVNSLVDRIVSAPIEPLGAVAEPYALWAIEAQPNLELPCQHESIRLVKNLAPLEWLKLSLLNLSHTYLVDRWLQLSESDSSTKNTVQSVETVAQAMEHPVLRSELEQVLTKEVIPILTAMNLGEDIQAYAESVRERFLNPFLDHKLSDIAGNHKMKIERRILPILQEGQTVLPEHRCPKLQACLGRSDLSLVFD